MGVKMGFIRDEMAVSEIMGEILMIGVVVIAFGAISTFLYAYLSGPDIPPKVDVSGIADDEHDTIYLKHSGGEWVGAGELKVILEINGTTYQYNYTGKFRLGDVIEINTSSEYGLDLERGEEIEFLLVHIPTGRVIASGELGYRVPDCSKDTSPPSSITNLRNTTFEPTYIIWAWDQPPDEDYSHARIYIDGEYKGTTSASWYNATGFDPGTAHTIGIRTVDGCGNVNSTWVNHTAKTYKPWWDTGWRYRRPITISSEDELSDYQIRLEVNWDSEMQDDFDDLRFTTQDDSPIPHWIELKANRNWASVWVKVPRIADGNTTIYMYYGNATATDGSSGSATFEFFDDFDAWSGWSNYGSGTVEWTSYGSEYVLKKNGSCDPSGGWKSLGIQVTDYRLVTRERREKEGSDCGMDRYGIEDSSYNGYNIYRRAYTSGSGSFGFERRTGGSSTGRWYKGLSQPYNNWYIIELRRDGSNFNASFFDGDDRGYIGSQTGSDSVHQGPFDRVVIRGGRPYYVDWIVLCKYHSPEPSYTIGDEEVY
ncbi:MAG TPA: DUF2341 domain-containing protein [Candidatus Syntrophoarchaeum butanivorans]|uniref:DUF2341 domain-containing protein n=1 Tax=Candidatus Syntropharchaeum butanivorans TaxID=1839936 RepID=A0A7C1AUP9_9EURY|nr:DUF2341 domain-containing protein [Candidatus Syntrophoarchaeum butanivorans]